ncbi:MAG: DUF2796 domain-containing protein [Moraxellaceae bacterium]|nr:DUF2796 domain-containing protein [Moraxellaceae bacterium]
MTRLFMPLLTLGCLLTTSSVLANTTKPAPANSSKHTTAKGHSHDPAHSHKAHVHGKALLTLALDKQQLEAALEAPAESITGFEHAPRTADHQQRILMALVNLKQKPLQFNTEAGCKATDTKVDNPFAGGGHQEHRDFDARYRFECATPGKLRSLDASALFRAFPRLKTLNVEYLLPGGQGSTTLTPARPRAELRQ